MNQNTTLTPGQAAILIFMFVGIIASFATCHETRDQPSPDHSSLDSGWIKEHSERPTFSGQIEITTQIYETPSPEGWNGWTSYTRISRGERLEGGFHWTFANVDSFWRAEGLLQVDSATYSTIGTRRKEVDSL